MMGALRKEFDCDEEGSRDSKANGWDQRAEATG